MWAPTLQWGLHPLCKSLYSVRIAETPLIDAVEIAWNPQGRATLDVNSIN
jgi:hypothetical protein